MLTRPWRRLLLTLLVSLLCVLFFVVIYQISPIRSIVYEYNNKSFWKHVDTEKDVVSEINMDILVKTRHQGSRSRIADSENVIGSPTTRTIDALLLVNNENENKERQLTPERAGRQESPTSEQDTRGGQADENEGKFSRSEENELSETVEEEEEEEEEEEDEKEEELSTQTTQDPAKKVIFIIGPGRTGTSLLGELFNTQKDFLYFFEPLKAVLDYTQIDYFAKTDLKKTMFYANEAFEFLRDIAKCSFRARNDLYLKQYDVKSIQKSKKLYSAFPKCRGDSCLPLNHVTMNRLCSEKNALKIVVKELSFRMPYGKMSSLEQLSLPDNFEILLLHAMRDPRAFLHSKQKLGWFGNDHINPNKHQRPYIQRSCSLIQQNIDDFKGNQTGKRVKYRLFRYEDLLLRNLTLFGESVERFLGFSKTSTNVADFFHIKTRSLRVRLPNPFSTVSRDIKKINNKWRNETNFTFVEQIQRLCAGVMEELGYCPATSVNHQRNTSISLIKAPSSELATFS